MGGNASAGPCGLKAWLDRERQAGRKPVPADDAVFGWAERVGLQRELLDLAWLAFRRRYLVQYPDKRYRDWRRVFRNAVEGNWLRLWYCDPREGFALTTVGVQAKRTLVEAAA